MLKILTRLPLVALLSTSATMAVADVSCGATALPRGSNWFLTVTSFSNTVCDIRITSRRGAFRGICATYDEITEDNIDVLSAPVSGRFIVNRSCGVTGTATLEDGGEGQTLEINGQLVAAGRSGSESPTMASGVMYLGDADGVPVLLGWQMARRANSNSFPALPTE